MKLVGFGCSFTYGSELVDPEVGEEFHHANTRYRERNVWLGQLASMMNCTWDNRGEPGNSNYAIQYQFADWFLNNRNPEEKVVVCVAWSEFNRFSWYSDSWQHIGFSSSKFLRSKKEWVANCEHKEQFTRAAKLYVNLACQAAGIPILQFNALGLHSCETYPNYFMNGDSMDSYLQAAMKSDSRLDLVAKGLHPNEAGHAYWTQRLYDFAKERIK